MTLGFRLNARFPPPDASVAASIPDLCDAAMLCYAMRTDTARRRRAGRKKYIK